ncbi:MAG: hypothetical protein MPN21_20100 [Thermoanaerobaculia bacterium]|nr:hypothetical protein [Thermoanaerobaculia bacterium]
MLTVDGATVETGGVAVPFDLEFRIFDHPDASQARQVGPLVALDGLPVVDGLVQTQLDFGAEIFQLPRRYLEIRFRRVGEDVGRSEWQVMRSQLQISAVAAEQEMLAPPESDADLLRRLEIARIVISDRQEPGKPHFLVDEQSFRRAYGVASPVTATDVASVAMVAASELRRQAIRSGERIDALEAEVSVLRFRSNLAFFLLAAMVVSVLLSRVRRPAPASMEQPESGETGDGAETSDSAAPASQRDD